MGELDSRQSRGAMMTSLDAKTTVTESKPVLESQLPIWKYRFALMSRSSCRHRLRFV